MLRARGPQHPPKVVSTRTTGIGMSDDARHAGLSNTGVRDASTEFSSDFTLGILGGGQLGKMLLTETRKFDITTKVLDPSPDAPCRIACNTFVQGNLKIGRAHV